MPHKRNRKKRTIYSRLPLLVWSAKIGWTLELENHKRQRVSSYPPPPPPQLTSKVYNSLLFLCLQVEALRIILASREVDGGANFNSCKKVGLFFFLFHFLRYADPVDKHNVPPLQKQHIILLSSFPAHNLSMIFFSSVYHHLESDLIGPKLETFRFDKDSSKISYGYHVFPRWSPKIFAISAKKIF